MNFLLDGMDVASLCLYGIDYKMTVLVHKYYNFQAIDAFPNQFYTGPMPHHHLLQ
jgi:hypothetical protein